MQCLMEGEDEEADCYLEKPLPLNELIALLKILNLKWGAKLKLTDT